MRTVIRAILVLALVAVAGLLLLGFWPALSQRTQSDTNAPAGTSGSIDTERAREVGAEIGQKAAVAAKKVQENVEEAALTTKIKAKMALDDTLKARAIDVSTEGTTVTVSGHVPTEGARQRAVALARETAGVSNVVDHLIVGP
jgi:hyperosmotically inducible protein